MFPDGDILEGLRARLDEAADYALLNGLLKYTPQGRLNHAPFALTPCPIDPACQHRMEALTASFNRLAHAVARDRAFLEDTLAPVAAVDDFTARLLKLARSGAGNQPIHLAVTRSDYFIHQPAPEAPPQIRQVELNTIAASYPGLAERVYRLHRFLLQDTPLERRLLPNDPPPVIAEAFAEAFARYGHPEARVLMIVQPGESNVFDQRLQEIALRERGLITRRASLEEVARQGMLKEGHLLVRGEVAAITYFRAAYGPEDFQSEDAFKARALIEASSTIAVPSLYAQLAGAKKVQKVLTEPRTLRRFLPSGQAAPVEACFAALYDLDEEVDAGGRRVAAWRLAIDNTAGFVLKPQREGGGNNYFDDELRRMLTGMTPDARPAYVLMERIRPAPHQAVLVREREARAVPAVSEIGRFGAYLADGEREVINRDAGYLVRTKERDTPEGGVSAGFGYLDSLLLTDPGDP